MADRNRMPVAQQKIYIAEQIWLHYYNDYLFGKGIITEETRNKLKFKICTRKASVDKKKTLPFFPPLNIHTFSGMGKTMATEQKMLSSESVFLRRKQRREMK